MKNKSVLCYLGIGIIVLLLIGIIVGFGFSSSEEVVVDENLGLEQYRTENIPLDCRLPVGENVESWKEHLSHHGNTLYCLEYFE